MTRYPQALSLTTVIVLASSCSLPLLRDIPAPAQAQVQVQAEEAPSSGPTSYLELHRRSWSTGCPSTGCLTPTLKTLAVAYRSAPDKPHDTSVVAATAPRESETPASPAPTAPDRPVTQASEREVIVYFGYADARLPPEAKATLRDALRDRTTLVRIAVRGRTDGLGASPANQRLAHSRANAVREHLLARDPSLAPLIEVEARGSCCYVAPNNTPAGRALNRRVEVTVVRQDPLA